MRVIEENIYLCTDCGMYVTYPTEHPKPADFHLDEEGLFKADSEKDLDFSRLPCEGCGSRLGCGYRMAFSRRGNGER